MFKTLEILMTLYIELLHFSCFENNKLSFSLSLDQHEVAFCYFLFLIFDILDLQNDTKNIYYYYILSETKKL